MFIRDIILKMFKYQKSKNFLNKRDVKEIFML